MDDSKKVLSYKKLSLFLSEIKKIFATKAHKHADADITSISSSKITGSISATSVPWSGVTGRPSTFPPSSHTHDDRYFTETEINTKLNDKANVSDLTSHTGNTTSHITATERTNWNSAKTHADKAHAPSNAQPNQNAFSNVTVGTTTVAADSTTDTLTLVAGNNVQITPDVTNDRITIAATDTKYTHPTHESKENGLYKVAVDSFGHVSAASKVTKADITALGIPGQDTNTTYSTMKGATTSVAGTQGLTPAPSAGASNRYLRSDGTWSVPPDTNTTYGVATQSANGLLSSTDKAKLDGIAAGANKYVLPTASSSTLGGVKTTSSVTSASGYTACPIVGGVPYYKDTNTTYSLGSFGITATATELNYMDGVTSNVQTQLNGKSASNHTHSQYAASSHTHTLSQVSGVTPSAIGAAPASHSHSYLPLSGGTLTGRLTTNARIYSTTIGGNWTSGMTLTNAALGISTQNTSGSYHPIIACKTYGSHVWNLGTIINSVGFYGFKKGRTENETDWSFAIDVTSGNITSTGTIKAPTFYGSLSGNASSASTATTATKLGTATKGSTIQPIYLNAGVPTACTYTLGKSVPSNAVFTDTTYTLSSITGTLSVSKGGTGSTTAAGGRAGLGACNIACQKTEPTNQNNNDIWFMEV